MTTVAIEQLEALAATAPKPTTPAHTTNGSAWRSNRHQGIDADAYVERLKASGFELGEPQAWKGGRKWVFGRCPFNSDHTNGSAFLIQFDSGAMDAGCHHNGCKGKGWPELRGLVEPDRHERFRHSTNGSQIQVEEKSVLAPEIVRLSNVRPEAIEWLWKNRLAIGKLNMVAGDPGLGKSLTSLDMTARVTRGGLWPDGVQVGPAGDVVLLSAEDDLADTIRPRLDAAGADVTRVYSLAAVRGRNDKGEYRRPVDLIRDLEAVETAIQRTPRCRLVVIDPITAYLNGVDSHNNTEVRIALAPIAELAARFHVAVLLVSHLRKGDGPAMYRTMGSLAFVAAARVVWAVAADRDDRARRLMLPIKNNLAPDLMGLAYRVTAGHGGPVVEWETAPVDISADDALGREQNRERSSALDEAVAWLRNFLADGPVHGKEVKKRAEEDGIALRTLERACGKLSIKPRPSGFKGAWVWTLPDENTLRPSPSESPSHKTLADMAECGNVGGVCIDDHHHTPPTESEFANSAKSASVEGRWTVAN